MKSESRRAVHVVHNAPPDEEEAGCWDRRNQLLDLRADDTCFSGMIESLEDCV